MSACTDCLVRQANLGDPSEARWKAPDGGEYCSMHFIQRFGHYEPLIRIEDYTPPEGRKAPAPKNGRKKKAAATDQVEA